MNWIIFLISNIVSDISSNIHKFLSPSADIPLQNAQTCKYSFRPPVSRFYRGIPAQQQFYSPVSQTNLPVSAYPVPGSDSHSKRCRNPHLLLDSILQFNNLSLPWNIHILPALPYCFVDIFHFFCFSVDIFSTCRFF